MEIIKSVARVQKYLDERGTVDRLAHLEVVHSIHIGAANETFLMLADLRALVASHAAQAKRIDALEAALKYYADGEHFMLSDESAWDTVSGEPMNFQCDEAGTATVEDGTLAKLVLAGQKVDFDSDEPVAAAPRPVSAPAEAGAQPDDPYLRVFGVASTAPVSAADVRDAAWRENLELVIARLEQIAGTEGEFADNLVDLVKEALPCAIALKSQPTPALHAAGSIGEDAKFARLAENWTFQSRYVYAKSSWDELVAYIDTWAASRPTAAPAGLSAVLNPDAVTAAVAAWRYSGNHPDSGNIDRIDIGCAIKAYLAGAPSGLSAAPSGGLTDLQKLQIVAGCASDDLERLHAELGLPDDDPIDVDDMIAAIQRMRAAFHVNMLRAFPGKSHEEITSEIEKACGISLAAPSAAPVVAVPEGDNLHPWARTAMHNLAVVLTNMGDARRRALDSDDVKLIQDRLADLNRAFTETGLLAAAPAPAASKAECAPCNGMGIQDGSGDACEACDGHGTPPAPDLSAERAWVIATEIAGTQNVGWEKNPALVFESPEAFLEVVRALRSQPAPKGGAQ